MKILLYNNIIAYFIFHSFSYSNVVITNMNSKKENYNLKKNRVW